MSVSNTPPQGGGEDFVSIRLGKILSSVVLAHTIPCAFFLFFSFLFWWAGGKPQRWQYVTRMLQSQRWQYITHMLQSQELKCATHKLGHVDVSLLSLAGFDEVVAMLGRPQPRK